MKKLLEYLPFHFLCFLILGIVLQSCFQIWSYDLIPLLFIFILGLLVLWIFRNQRFFHLCCFLLFTYAGVCLVFITDDRSYPNYFEHFDSTNVFKVLVIRKVLKPNKIYDKYEAEVIRIDDNKTKGMVLLNVRKDSLQETLFVGQALFTLQEFKAINNSQNPHQFDYKKFLARRGIHKQIFLDTNQFVMATIEVQNLASWAFSIRNSIQQSLLKTGFSGDEYAIMNALLLGQRNDISPEVSQDYIKAGAIHILAVSGLHIGILFLVLKVLLIPMVYLPNGKFMQALLMIFLLWIFAILVGGSPSVLRAVSMFSAVAIGQFLNRPSAVERSLILSMFVLLLFTPLLVFDVGFQLSYTAVFSIVWIQPRLASLWQPKWRVINYYWQLICVSVAAQIGVLPLSLFYFHQFPGLFFVSNLFIVPLLGLVLIGGFGVILLSVFDMLPSQIQESYVFVIRLLNGFVRWISAQESWLFTEIPFSWKLMIVVYVVLISLYQFVSFKRPVFVIFFLLSVFSLQVTLWYEKWEIENKMELIVFQQSRKSVMVYRTGRKMIVYNHVNQQNDAIYGLQDYRREEGIKSVTFEEMPNYIELGNHAVFIVNNSFLQPLKTEKKQSILILQNSAKINLDRWIQILQPSCIIADGSNYASMISQWQMSCLKLDIPFWYTGQQGAYLLK